MAALPNMTPPKGWHSRGYLLHFDGGTIPQTVTFRLADALPKAVLDRWENELATMPEAGLPPSAANESNTTSTPPPASVGFRGPRLRKPWKAPCFFSTGSVMRWEPGLLCLTMCMLCSLRWQATAFPRFSTPGSPTPRTQLTGCWAEVESSGIRITTTVSFGMSGTSCVLSST